MTRLTFLRLLSASLLLLGMPALASAAAPLTRAQFVETVVRQLYPHDLTRDCFTDIAPSQPRTYTRLFADVPLTHRQAQVLCLGINYGLLDGDQEARFRPDAPINVAEAGKILAIAHGVSLPDSIVIRKLGWHWRFTEALKRRGVLPRNAEAYSQPVTPDDLARMLQALRPMRPRLLQPVVTPQATDKPTSAQSDDRDAVATSPVRVAPPTNGRARPHRGTVLRLAEGTYRRAEPCTH